MFLFKECLKNSGSRSPKKKFYSKIGTFYCALYLLWLDLGVMRKVFVLQSGTPGKLKIKARVSEFQLNITIACTCSLTQLQSSHGY